MKTQGRSILIGTVLVVMVLTMVADVALAGKDETGRGGPSGPHYNLNIIGVPKDKNPNMGCGKGHRIFVPLGEMNTNGKKPPKMVKIYLDKGAPGEFEVTDCDATDDGVARFTLPDPNGGSKECTAYSVWVRPRGKPGGSAVITTCATDPCTSEVICSEDKVNLSRTKGQQKFRNVSLELLTICAEVCTEVNEDGDCITWEWMRLYLFDPRLEGYFWKYENNGLKLAQLRFYYDEDCSRKSDWACPPE